MSSPRIVYIDLNHWIALAKARKAGDLVLENRLANLVDNGAIAVPVSALHIMEISSILKETQRSDLSSILRSITRGNVLRPLDVIRYLEAEVRLAAHFGIPRPSDLRPYFLTTGYLRAFGEPSFDFTPWRNIDPQNSAVAEKQLQAELESDALLDSILSQYRAKIGKGSADHSLLKQSLEQIRKTHESKSLDEAEQDCVLELTRSFYQLVIQAAKELRISEPQLLTNPPRHFWTKEYLASVPTVNVWSKLHLYLARAMNREMTVNDLYDIAHLAVAVPYCDVVVADSAMAHLLTFRKLNQVYKTAVYSDLSKCVSDLENT